MRRLGLLMLISAATLLVPAAAQAGAAAKCRKACKPFVAECRLTTGQSKRACKKQYIPACRQQGLQVCSTTATTSPTSPGPSTTSTTVPSSGEGGGVMFMRIEDVAEEPSGDQTLFTFTISIEYGIVTSNAVTQIPLDTASFTVRDDDTGDVYPAQPASAPDDCSVSTVIALDGPPAICKLRFLLPLGLGQPSPIDGGVHSYLEFEASGLHASRDF
jgi:hypothetical protein